MSSKTASFKLFLRILKQFLTFLVMMTLWAPVYPGSTSVSTENSKDKYGGTLRLGWYRKPEPLNPFRVTDSISSPIMELIFSRLIRFDLNGEFSPDLAEKWEVSEDGLIYTFYLRKDVFFHDGIECTAQDVLYTYELFTDPKISPGFYQYFDIVKEWRALSKYEFQVILKKPYSPILLSLWRAYIVPKHLLSNPYEGGIDRFIYHPIGTGPFVLETKDVTTGDIELKTSEDYFEGHPKVERITFQIFPSKKRVWAAFLRNEIDMVFYLDRQDYEELRDNSSFQVFSALSTRGYMFLFNLKDPLFANQKIREAITAAINSEETLQILENGEGLNITGPFHPHLLTPTIRQPIEEYNPQLAIKLLLEEGYTFKNGQMQKDGIQLSFEFIVDPEKEHLLKMGKLIRQQLQEIGVKAHLRPIQHYQSLVFPGSSKFQAFLLIYNAGPVPDALAPYWETFGPFNWIGYSNPKVDGLFTKARVSLDREVRRDAYRRIHSIIEREKPAAFLYIPRVFHAASLNIENAEMLSSSFFQAYSLKEIQKK